MRQTLASEIKQEAENKIADANRDAAGKVRKAQQARRAAEREAAELGNALSAVGVEDQNIVSRLIGDVNAAVRRRRRITKGAVGLAVFLIGALPLLTESISGIWKTVSLVVTGAVGGAFAFFQLLDKPTGLEACIENFAQRKLSEFAINRGLDSKLSKFPIEYSNGEFRLRPNTITTLVD